MKLSIEQSNNKKVIEFINFDDVGNIIEKNDNDVYKIEEINSEEKIQRFIIFK